MALYRVGCVPYVNAIPLIYPFVSGLSTQIEVVFEVPSRLPSLHQAGEIDCMLVSSIESLRHKNSYVVGGVCIGSDGPVESVRLFSQVPFQEITTLALDQSSMTSNALAQIILKEQFKVTPQMQVSPPNLERMLDVCDAAVIIGDNGLTANMVSGYVLDLGKAWTEFYSAPFVWAMWTSHKPIESALATLLQEAIYNFECNPEPIFHHAAKVSGWDIELVRRYLSTCVQFTFSERQINGLQLYANKLIEFSILPEVTLPSILDAVDR